MHFFCQKPPEMRLLFDILNVKRQSTSLAEAISVIGHQVTFTAPGTGHIDVYEPPAAAASALAPTDETAPADRTVRKMRSNHASPNASVKSRVNSSSRLVEGVFGDAAAVLAVVVEEKEKEAETEPIETNARSRGSGFRETGSVKAMGKQTVQSGENEGKFSQPLQSGENEGKFRGSVKARRRASNEAAGGVEGFSSAANGKESGAGASHADNQKKQSWSIVKVLTNPFKHITKGRK